MRKNNKLLQFLIYSFIVSIFSLMINAAWAANPNMLNWNEWVQGVRQEAINQGISSQLFDKLFQDIHAPQPKILHLDRTQPEKRISFIQYRSTRIDPFRIRLGQKEYKKHQAILQHISQHYGVDPCMIVAVWGIETSYGRYMGDFPVIRALATLAYDSPRANYFRNELLIALHILNEGHVDISKFKGEWAGASGHPQFMPSSWKKYAVDFDHDGRKDIWSDYTDAFASIANYFSLNGWQPNQPWAIPVRLPAHFPSSEATLKNTKTVAQWLAEGVKPELPLPSSANNLVASIIRPIGGPDFMVFKNFRVIMKYNNSIFYAGSVGYLADKICQRS